MTWRDGGFVALLVLLVLIAGVQLWRAVARNIDGDVAHELRGLLEGARADAIQYARTAEKIADALQSAHGHIAHLATPLGVKRPPTPGQLALQQLAALNADGSAGYYGKPVGRVVGSDPWIPPAAAELAQASAAEVQRAAIDAVIRKRAGADARLSRHLRGVADELLGVGFDSTEVARRILEGDPVDAG